MGKPARKNWTYVEGCEDLWTERDRDIFDSPTDSGEVESNHLCGVRIIERAIEAVSSDSKAKLAGDARTEVCQIILHSRRNGVRGGAN